MACRALVRAALRHLEDQSKSLETLLAHLTEVRVQVTRYLAALTDRMAWLAAAPELGKARDDVARGYRSFPEGRHLIFYIEADGGISIIGVPHSSMDTQTLSGLVR